LSNTRKINTKVNPSNFSVILEIFSYTLHRPATSYVEFHLKSITKLHERVELSANSIDVCRVTSETLSFRPASPVQVNLALTCLCALVGPLRLVTPMIHAFDTLLVKRLKLLATYVEAAWTFVALVIKNTIQRRLQLETIALERPLNRC